jgi:hypothetical protein
MPVVGVTEILEDSSSSKLVAIKDHHDLKTFPGC